MDLIENLEQRAAALKAENRKTLEDAVAENRGLTEDEKATYDQRRQDAEDAEARAKELREDAERAAKADQTRAESGVIEERTGGAQVTDPPVYAKDRNDTSYFRDLGRHMLGTDHASSERLRRHAAMRVDEQRALGNTGAVGGSGGEFAPPKWLVDEWVNLIRPGRITADLFPHQDVPAGFSSINYPKILTGTTTAIQSTQNTALSQTDMTTSYVQTGFATIGGKQVVSQQLLDQTAIAFDRVVLGDLAADYGQRVGQQVFIGSGNGSGTGAVVNGLSNATAGSTVTWTQASPTGALFYSQAGKLLSQFLTSRLMPPTAWIMSPRRWYWLASQTDSNGRPLVVPVGQAYNQIAQETNAAQAAGMVGYLHGVPVYLDPQVPTNIGSGTNQDVVYLLRTDDLVLFESAPQVEVFRETYADSVGVLFRMYAYVGTVLNRHPESIGLMTGTGLVTPTFAG